MSFVPNTAMAAAMARAGVDVGKTRLYNAAVDLLRKAGRNPLIAHDSFVEALEADSPMLAALLGRQEVARVALDYLRTVAGDMSGTRGGQSGTAHQRANAPATHSDGEGQTDGGSQVSVAPSSETSSAGGGQTTTARQRSGAPAGAPQPPAGSAITPLPKASPRVPPGRRPPNPPRGLGAIRAATEAMRTVMDTYRIDGRPIGDWTFGEAATAGRRKTREGALLLAVSRHYANADPSLRIRDAIKVEDLQREIQRAAEVADAAIV